MLVDSPTINIEEVHRRARLRWLREEAPRRNFTDLLSASVPYWLVIIASVFFILSAPHTAGVFHTITPGFGLVAPLGIEFGLLYAAFRRTQDRRQARPTPRWLWVFEGLLIVTAILVNGAGALSSVANDARLSELSAGTILASLPRLPLSSQAGLLMAFLSAFIIPAGALVAGEGMANLLLESRSRDASQAELRWREVELDVLYRALYALYVSRMEAAEARNRAYSESRGYLGRSPFVRSLPSVAQKPNERTGKQALVRSWLDAHPECRSLSVSVCWKRMANDGLKVGRTTVAEVLKNREA